MKYVSASWNKGHWPETYAAPPVEAVRITCMCGWLRRHQGRDEDVMRLDAEAFLQHVKESVPGWWNTNLRLIDAMTYARLAVAPWPKSIPGHWVKAMMIQNPVRHFVRLVFCTCGWYEHYGLRPVPLKEADTEGVKHIRSVYTEEVDAIIANATAREGL